MKIYIASSEKYLGKIKEDIYIRDTYRSKGFPCEISTLDDIAKISKPSDVVILKSVWGYHLHHREFLKNISVLKKKNIKLINDYQFIFWNIDKYKYLSELKHINAVPTALLNFKNTETASEIRNIILLANKKLNTDILVIKPCISESGYLTFKYDKTKDNKATIALLKKNKQVNFVAQPYRPDILTGELSAVIINGIPLYGVKRFPGIFSEKLDPKYVRFNSLPGGIRQEVDILKIFLLKKFGTFPNICRVDFLKISNIGYEISEVEVIDPDLFFRHIPGRMREKVTSMIYKTFIV